jgi:DNA-binding PadR family transcriptional regulator
MLFLLSERPRTGYNLRRELNERYGLNLSYGTLYPMLGKFRREMLIVNLWESENQHIKAKKLYKVTDAGLEILKQTLSDLEDMAKQMESGSVERSR